MKRLFILSLLLFSSWANAGACYQLRAFYGCSNASGTSCTKVAVTALVPSALAANDAGCPAVVISPVEYVSFLNDAALIANQNAQITALQNADNVLNSNVSSLSSALSTLQTAYNATVTRVNDLSTSLTQTSGSLSSLSSQLNVPFDLQTALLGTAFFFSTVLFFYAVAKIAGAILTGIKNPLRRGQI